MKCLAQSAAYRHFPIWTIYVSIMHITLSSVCATHVHGESRSVPMQAVQPVPFSEHKDRFVPAACGTVGSAHLITDANLKRT